MLRQKQDFIGTASGSKMKRPQEAFCYQIPLTLPAVTFIRAEGTVPKSDFTSESARLHRWSCDRRKKVGRRQSPMQTVAREKGKRLREKENGLVLLPKPSLKLLGRWVRWGSALSNKLFSNHFSCQMGKEKRFPPNHWKVCPLFPASFLLFSKADEKFQPSSSWAGSMLLPWASQSRTNLIFLHLPFTQCVSYWWCLEDKFLGPGTTLRHMFDKCVDQWEPLNLHLLIATVVMLIITSTVTSQQLQEWQESFVASSLAYWQGALQKVLFSCFPSVVFHCYLKVWLLLLSTLILPTMEHLRLLIILENHALLCLFLGFSRLCNGNKAAYPTVISQSTFGDSSKGHLWTKHY